MNLAFLGELKPRTCHQERQSRSLRKRARLCLEELESRCLLSVTAAAAVPGAVIEPGITNGTVVGYTPAQIQSAYQFNQISFLQSNYDALAGKGQTIAIVDVYDDPNIASDLKVFDKQFGLPDPTFTKVNEHGSSTGPFPRENSQWAGEISLDVEWAHAIAPAAKILLVEAASGSTSDCFAAIDTARNWAGVTVVSMSWGWSEFSSETRDESHFTTPAGHVGVTFVAATLDNGARYGNYYPAISPNVLAVGGTTLTLNGNGNWTQETGWQYGGGGISKYESQPSYQNGVVSQSSTKRTNPDVAYDADPNTGVAIYDTVPYDRETGWFDAGGTSAGTPQWAALVALANQGRTNNGGSALDGPSQTIPTLYNFATGGSYATYFHDITTGYNGYYAGTGYDLVTGLGTPYANQVVQGLMNAPGGSASAMEAAGGTSQAGGPAIVAAETVMAPANGTGYDLVTGLGAAYAYQIVQGLINAPGGSASAAEASAVTSQTSVLATAVAEPVMGQANATTLGLPAISLSRTDEEGPGVLGSDPKLQAISRHLAQLTPGDDAMVSVGLPDLITFDDENG